MSLLKPPRSARKLSIRRRARSSASCQSGVPTRPFLNCSQSKTMETVQSNFEVTAPWQRIGNLRRIMIGSGGLPHPKIIPIATSQSVRVVLNRLRAVRLGIEMPLALSSVHGEDSLVTKLIQREDFKETRCL